MAKRGNQLSEHILWVAKDVFLKMGFERASMDAVATRAETSKTSLYAHFENKEKLFLAVIELVRGLFLDRIGVPDDYSDKPVEALVLFCGRYLEILLYEPSIQMLRISMAQSKRFPEQSTQYFDVLFTQVHARLSVYLKTSLGFTNRSSTESAQRLLAQVLFPRLQRALLGVDPLSVHYDREKLSPDLDLKPIRKAVEELLELQREKRVPSARTQPVGQEDSRGSVSLPAKGKRN